MKQIRFKKAICLSFITGLFSLNMGVVSCLSEDNEAPDTGERADGRKLRQLTISEVSLTRAMLTEQTVGGKHSLGAAWKENDKATFFNLSELAQGNVRYSELTASSSTETSAFTGSVYCEELDRIALIYPAVEIITQDDPSKDELYKKGDFYINLSGQDGTLDLLAQKYHCVYGVGKVTSVTETMANATIFSIKSLLAVCKFKFKDGSDTPIPVRTLKISYGDDLSVGYPQKATVTPSVTMSEVIATPEASEFWENPLIVTLDSETSDGVFVALFPVIESDFYFSVTNSSGSTYTGTATVNLKAGKYYYKELTLTKQ